MRVSDEAEDEEFAFNLAPMIDVVFLLLIFFMVATTFIEREEEFGLELPRATSGEEPIREVEELVISVMEDGRILLNGDEFSGNELRNQLEIAARQDAQRQVTIRGDRNVRHEQIVTVLDACSQAGLRNLGLRALDG